ncbi:HCP-like protein [Gigaspora margarita]|uniref:HCP-like protein n=1 Tax=Gigaspora margarita TaxID=4874 RepID=A0A8H4EHP9_GIGMA|nr:HCP-like protein [Gigaspora margarita]
MNNKFREFLEKEFKNIKTIEQLQKWNKKQNVNCGFVFTENKICPSYSPTFSTDTKVNINILSESSRKFKAKLNVLTKKIDSILLENHIDDPNFAESTRNNWIVDDKNSLIENSSVNNIYLEIQCPLVELIFEKKTVHPIKDLKDEVEKALENENPYRELMNVFNTYGHLLPQKVIIGHKLYRKSYLFMNHENNNSVESIQIEWKTLNDFKMSKFEEIMKRWESYIEAYDFDTNYFVSLDGEIVMRDKLEMWIDFCLEGNIYPLQIINWCDLYPLYEIFDSPLRKNIEFILGEDVSDIKEKVLMTGALATEKDVNYYRVNFFPNDDNQLESNNYQIFGKLIKRDGNPIDEVIVTFKSKNIYGFSAIIENFGIIKDGFFKNSLIIWIMIGIPKEVGYFSTNSRNIIMLSFGNNSFTPPNLECEWNITLNVPKNLHPNSILVTSFKNPSTSLIANIQNYHDKKIKLNIRDLDNTEHFEENLTGEYSKGDSNIEFSIQWCIVLFSDNLKVDKANDSLDSTMTTVYFKAIGENVQQPAEIDQVYKLIQKEDMISSVEWKDSSQNCISNTDIDQITLSEKCEKNDKSENYVKQLEKINDVQLTISNKNEAKFR